MLYIVPVKGISTFVSASMEIDGNGEVDIDVECYDGGIHTISLTINDLESMLCQAKNTKKIGKIILGNKYEKNSS